MSGALYFDIIIFLFLSSDYKNCRLLNKQLKFQQSGKGMFSVKAYTVSKNTKQLIWVFVHLFILVIILLNNLYCNVLIFQTLINFFILYVSSRRRQKYKSSLQFYTRLFNLRYFIFNSISKLVIRRFVIWQCRFLHIYSNIP